MVVNGPPKRTVFDEIAERLATARRVLFVTGAGISADSGLPTYRGIGGLYEDELTEDRLPIEAALSGEMLAVRPEVTWKYLHQIESACRGRCCNEAHRIIARLESRFQICVLTQNIDGFHRQAGSSNVIEIHGDIHELYCIHCRDRRRVRDFAGMSIPPRCTCGGVMRPDVVLFGEYLPPSATERLRHELTLGFDMVFTIGTGSVFPYIAAPVREAAVAGVPTVEINPGITEVSALVDYRIKERAVTAMAGIERAVSAALGG